jgi:hypothetical protein
MAVDEADRKLGEAMRAVVDSSVAPIDPRRVLEGTVATRRHYVRSAVVGVLVPLAAVAIVIGVLWGRGSSHHQATRPSGTTPTSASTPTTFAGTSLPTSQILAWTQKGQLVVLDVRDGHEMRQLTTVPVNIGTGPSGVLLTPDRTQAIIWWSTAEPGCFEQLGMIRIDGSGGTKSLGKGTAPTLSPDGRRLAWREITDPDCANQSLVIRDLATGAERRIDASGQSGYSPRGPWWKDNRTLVFADANQPLTGTAVASVALDADQARTLADGKPTSFACTTESAALAFASQPFGSTDLIVTTLDTTGRILRCSFDGSAPIQLATSDEFFYSARPDATTEHFLCITRDNALVEVTPGSPPRTIAAGKFQSAAW